MKMIKLSIILVCMLMPLTLFALPISTLNSGTSLLFFNTLYSGRILPIIFNTHLTCESGLTIPSPNESRNSHYNPPIGQCNIQGGNFINYNPPTEQPTAPVPEPATMLLLGSGIMGLASLKNKLKIR